MTLLVNLTNVCGHNDKPKGKDFPTMSVFAACNSWSYVVEFPLYRVEFGLPTVPQTAGAIMELFNK